MKRYLSFIGILLSVTTIRSQEVVWIDTLPKNHGINTLVKDGQGIVASAGFGNRWSNKGGLAIFRYSPDGQQVGLDTILAEGPRRGGSGTAVDTHGNLYTSFYVEGDMQIHGQHYNGGSYLIKHDKGGNLVWVKPGPTCLQTEISVRNAYVYLKGTCGIQKFDTAGKMHATYLDPYDHKFHAVDNAGMIYTGVRMEVRKIQPDGKLAWAENNYSGAYFTLSIDDRITILEDEDAYPASCMLKKLDTNGKQLWKWNSSTPIRSEAITAASDGGSYLVLISGDNPSDYKHILTKIDKNGQHVWDLELPYYDPDNNDWRFSTLVAVEDCIYLGIGDQMMGQSYVMKIKDKALLAQGIKELPAKTVRMFPNPSRETIRFESDRPITHVMVFDVKGKTLFESTPPSPSLSYELKVSNFSAGVYKVEIRTNEQTIIQKIIVQ